MPEVRARAVTVPAFSLQVGTPTLMPGTQEVATCVGASPVFKEGSGLTLPGGVASSQRELAWIIVLAKNEPDGTTALHATSVPPQTGVTILVPVEELEEDEDAEPAVH